MVRHILADGREVPDITGRVVQVNEKTKAAYHLIITDKREGMK